MYTKSPPVLAPLAPQPSPRPSMLTGDMPALVAVGYADLATAERTMHELEKRDLNRTHLLLKLEETDKPHLLVSFEHEDVTSTEVLRALAVGVSTQDNHARRFAEYDAYFRSELGESLGDRVERLKHGVMATGTLSREETAKLLAIEHSYDQQVEAFNQGGLDLP